MPAAIPPAGGDGLPLVSTRVFQLLDQGNSVFIAVYRAVTEYVAAVVRYFGEELITDIGEIGQ